MPRSHVAAFLDTMVYLHYRPIHEIDWRTVLDANRVELVVPRITIRELDRHKNQHALTKIRERARHTLSSLEDCFAHPSAELRPGVLVRGWMTLPSFDLASHGLHQEWNDDVLVASLASFRDANPDITVVLVTQDSGPRLTARQFGLEAISLPTDYRLPEELDPLEVENRKLRNRLQRLEGAMPRLTLDFANADDPTHRNGYAEFRLRTMDTDIATSVRRALTEAENAFPHLRPVPPGPPLNLDKLAGLKGRDLLGFGTLAAEAARQSSIPQEEFERYAKDREVYLGEIQVHARRCWEAEAERRRSFAICLAVRNDGTRPADDIDVSLHVPDGPIVSRKRPPKAPEPPEQPELPLSPTARLFRSIGAASDFRLAGMRGFRPPDIGPPANVSSFTIKKSNSFDIDAHVRRVKHGVVEPLDPLYLTFASLDGAKSLHIDYVLRAANLPDPVEGKLHVVVSI